jgi:hypothetical protein
MGIRRNAGLVFSCGLAVVAFWACNGCAAETYPEFFEKDGIRIRLLAENAVGPSWIAWESANLHGARLVYVDTDEWELRVMDENGGNKKSLSKRGANVLGVDFPLDDAGAGARPRWKGDPEAHPTAPVILFKAENENSPHRALRNSPSIGWANGLGALNVETRAYTRLTRLAPGQGLQHTAISEDGKWYVYPLRYDFGDPPEDFGFARMVFNELLIDEKGEPRLVKRFEAEPNGKMYYEPIDVRRGPSGRTTLLYVAGTGNLMDPYKLEWSADGVIAQADIVKLQDTPELHEEFTTFDPAGDRIVWMRGPRAGYQYDADLYVSKPDFTQAERLTWFNDREKWPEMGRSHGAQPSRLDWKGDGRTIFFGLWTHGPMLPFRKTHLYRLDLPAPGGDPGKPGR